jgi:general secretion pathway protein J
VSFKRELPVGNEGGFTLLELLVTLALLSLLSLALFGSIAYGTRIWEAARSIETKTENVRLAQQTLARLISTAYPKFVVKDALHASVALDGETESLDLLAPSTQVPGALDVITIHETHSPDTGTLVVDRKLELGENSQRPNSETLLKGLQTLTFRYFGPLKPGGKPKWQNTWTDRSRPPLLIRITAVLANHVEWPDLTVAPQIAADVSCTLDRITGFCQGR